MRYLLVLLFILPVNRFSHAQDADTCHAGVYVTPDDFVHNRLSYKINSGKDGYKVDFLVPADLTLTVRVITPDSTYKFAPGSIYGFNDCGKIFRYFPEGGELNAQEDFYKIEEAKGLIIYSSVLISDGDIFYSKDLTSPVHRLTFGNLKSDFSKDTQFIAAAKKLNRKTGEGLATKDEEGHFLVNKIYGEAMKSKR